MDSKRSPQEIREDFLQRLRVAAADVESMLTFGEDRRWFFTTMEQKGVLEREIRIEDWRYREYNANSITLPPLALRRLRSVQGAGFPIRQVIYGDRIGDQVKAEPQPKRSIRLPDHALENAAKTVLTLSAAVAWTVSSAFILALSAMDPKLIVVLDTGAAESELPWICLMSWDA